MTGSSSSRQILSDLLQGSVAFRPLFVPIVFALGARVENLSLRAFLANPTKISNSLRQTRSHLRSDGVSCYFDSLLEAEALGGTLEWPSEEMPPVLRWPKSSEQGQLPTGLRPPEEIIKSGRVPVALEVIRRLKTVLREESLLMVGVSGPLTLASRLTGLHMLNPRTSPEVPDSALEVATSAVTQVSKAFAEAGANLIFLREETLPARGAGALENWMALLAPIFNIIRFYEALPVLQIAIHDTLAKQTSVILESVQGCVVCATPEVIRHLSDQQRAGLPSAAIGVSLSAAAFCQDSLGDPGSDPALRPLIFDLRPAIVTTTDDVPAATDLKRLAAISELVRR